MIVRRYTVSRRVDKICDTVSGSGSRRTHSTVYLEDLRCDGSGHDGCQAACKIYWKDLLASPRRRSREGRASALATEESPNSSGSRRPAHEPCVS